MTGCNTCYLPRLFGLGEIPAGFVPPSVPSFSPLPMGSPMTAAETDALAAVARAWVAATGLDPSSGEGAAKFESFLGAEYPALIKAAYRSEGLDWPPKTSSAVTVEVNPEAIIASYDAPTTGGPWALNSNGQWFEYKGPQPAGSQVLTVDGRKIYVPAEHPSVRIKESNYGAGSAHEKRWSEQKFRAANRALLGSDPFKTLFFRVAPRGGWGNGQGYGRAFDGTPEDYAFEGGDLYPNLEGGPLAQSLADWYGHNSFDNKYGYPRGLTLNWLRVFTGPDGYRHYKKWSPSEASDYANRWHMAETDYVCGGDEVLKIAQQINGWQAERDAAQTEGDYSVHWPWAIGPLSQCSPTSSSRRRKLIKKVAVVGALVAGAIFLGPAIAAKVKLVAAKIGGIAGKAAGSAVTAAAKKGSEKDESSGEEQLQTILTNTVGAVNAARTLEAIKNGSVPPPPVSMTGDSFAQWATSIGMSALQSESAQKMTAAQEAEMQAAVRNEVLRIQGAAQSYPPVQYMTPSVELSPAVQSVQQGEAVAAKAANQQMLIYGGLGLLALMMLTQNRR